TVWAWGGWRAKAGPKSVDTLLCLFPFEPPYFTPHGVDAVAVGHPYAQVNPLDRATARSILGLDDGRVLALLPGSRKREVMTLLPKMLEAAGQLVARDPSLQVILPVAASVEKLVAPMIAELPFVQLYPQQMSPAVMAAGDFGLICSGTATLEAALSGLPGHVYYQTDPITTFFGQFLVNKKNIVLANAVAGVKIYPLSL
ncbi:MAG: lipid-A-disaccharide synthase, partial [Alphaproteobacteria bacterium]|nr:lipid-A-disaccharide synthase [Alphaproteobacteria bacterium]